MVFLFIFEHTIKRNLPQGQLIIIQEKRNHVRLSHNLGLVVSVTADERVCGLV